MEQTQDDHPLLARIKAIQPQLVDTGAFTCLMISTFVQRDDHQPVIVHLLATYAQGRDAANCSLDLFAQAKQIATDDLPAIGNPVLMARERETNDTRNVRGDAAPFAVIMAWARPLPISSREHRRLHTATHGSGDNVQWDEGRHLAEEEFESTANDEGYGPTFHLYEIMYEEPS